MHTHTHTHITHTHKETLTVDHTRTRTHTHTHTPAHTYTHTLSLFLCVCLSLSRMHTCRDRCRHIDRHTHAHTNTHIIRISCGTLAHTFTPIEHLARNIAAQVDSPKVRTQNFSEKVRTPRGGDLCRSGFFRLFPSLGLEFAVQVSDCEPAVGFFCGNSVS
jgi:hypothetical protein